MVVVLGLLRRKEQRRLSERNRNQKRRDKKGRILRNGESQRADGRYAFVYTDCFGKQKFLYSWKLESTDSLPAGRRPCQSLREKEKAILKDNTEANYNFVINIIKKEKFGAKRIDKVKLSDAKAWLIKLQADGRGYSTIHSVRGVVRPAFQMAVDDDLIRKNPFEFQLCTVVVNDSVTREAITRKQARKFLEFIKNDEHYKRYYDGMFILFKTGLRISEFCGLTLSDIDFEEKQISVNHQLQRTRGMKYIIEDTKTSSGTRIIPMTEEVYECFKRIVENRKKPKKEPVIDEYKGFLFLDKKDMLEVALHWEKHFEWALAKHNRIYKEQLPKITPHVCRHTYCSNMAKSGINPKTLQYLMGHSDIGVTLNTYTHLGAEDAKEELGKYAKMA